MSRLPGWRVRRRRPGRLHDRAGAGRLPRPLRRVVRRAGRAEDTTVEVVEPNRDGYRVVTDRGLDRPQRRDRHRMVRSAARAGGGHRTLRRTCTRPRRPPTGTRPSCPTEACSWSVHRRRASSWPTSSTHRVARSSWPSAGTAAFRAATGAWTSAGGSIGSACCDKTIDEVADPTVRPPRAVAAARRPSRPARTSTWSRCARRGVRLTGRLIAIDDRPRRRSPTTSLSTTAEAELRMHRMLTAVNDHVADHGLEAEVLEPEILPSGIAHSSLGSLDLGRGAHHHRDVGHRLPPRVPLAAGARPRRDRRDPPAARRHPGAGAVRARPAIPASAQLGLHRRRRSRTPRAIAGHLDRACRTSTSTGCRR